MGIISIPRFPVGLTSGYSDRIDISAQVGRPGGVESVFEFNGSYFNVRTWLDTFLITTIDGFADPDIRDSREVNPGRHGETYFNSYYGGRTLVLSGKLRAQTLGKMRNMQMGLKEIFGDISREYPLIIRTGDLHNDVMIYCKKSQPLVMSEVQQDFTFRRDFQITLRASNPYFFSVVEVRSTADFDAGFTETFDTDAFVSYTNIIENSNGYYTSNIASTPGAQYGTIVLTAATDSTNNPNVYRITNTIARAPTTPSYSPLTTTLRSAANTNFTCVAGQRISLEFKQSGRSNNGSYPPPGYAIHNRAFINFYGPSSFFSQVPIAFTGTPGNVTFRDVVTVPNGANAFNIQHQGYLYDSRADVVTFELWGFMAVIGDPAPTTFFDGYSQNARWASTPGRSQSEFLGATGLEDSYSFASGAGNAYARSGKLYANGNVNIARLKRNGFNKMRSFISTVEYNTNSVAAPNGVIEHSKIVSPAQWLFGSIMVNGASTRLKLGTAVSDLSTGQTILRESASAFTVVNNTTYWSRTTFNGNVITVEHWTTDPRLGGSPTQSISATLTGGDINIFGENVPGDAAIALGGANFYQVRVDNHNVTPVPGQVDLAFAPENRGNAAAPTVIRLFGQLNAAVNGGPAATVRTTNRALDELSVTINAPAGTRQAIPADHYIEIDSWNRTAKLYDSDGVLISSVYQQLDIESDWIELSPGVNQVEFITYSITGTPSLEMHHRHTYL
jgi:hypothetical protein